MRIGFIDYYIDEWHANNYPRMIAEASEGQDTVIGVYALIDQYMNRRTTDEWCSQMGIPHYDDIGSLVNNSDALIVLSPDNPEKHEELSRIPLISGKPVYIDKTFAPDGDTAKRIFELAEKYGTPCCSTSALRYATEYTGINPEKVQAVTTWGPQDYPRYSIHQLEPIMMFIKSRARRVMANCCDGYTNIVIEFADGRCASLTTILHGSPFMTNVVSAVGNQALTIKSDFFMEFIKHLIEFLHTGRTEITHDETIRIIETRSAGLKAIENPGIWIEV